MGRTGPPQGTKIVAGPSASENKAFEKMPPSAGKTLVLTLVPYILRANRVLVVTPSRLVRNQIADEIAVMKTARIVGALAQEIPSPRSYELVHRIDDQQGWEVLRHFDVVVATPNGVSPFLEPVPAPPPDLFDLLLIDEAHQRGFERLVGDMDGGDLELREIESFTHHVHALDFANTVGYRFNPNKCEDHLGTEADIRRWAKVVQIEGFVASRRLDLAEVETVRDVRENAFAVFYALAAGAPVPLSALRRLDDRLREYQAKRRLIIRGGRVQWGGHPAARDVTTAMILYPILADAADLLTSGPLNRIRHCADRDCGWLFLDRSNSGRRRWCRMADCGNRNKVKEYYRRGR